ncbi:cingulin-like protein [Pimephales promelas]|nr:cingulin-like protein [Pimephales promelas]
MESPRRSAPADGDSGCFGLRVRVQGVSGQPCVVLNTQRNLDSPDYPDVFPMEPPWQQECVSSMSGGASSAQTPPDQSRSSRSSQHPWAQQNQRNPETLRWSSSPNSPVVVKRARIPVPAAGFPGPVVESVPCRPAHIISRACVPQEQNPSGSPRHHSRTTPEEKRRSRRPSEKGENGPEIRSSEDETAIRRQVELMFRALEENQQSLLEEKEERAAELERLQEALERSEQEQVTLRHKLTDMEKELQTSLDQLLQARRARDQCRSDMRDLQQQLSDIHDELDSAKSCEAGERDGLLQELCVLRGEFQALQLLQEEQEEVLRRRERELTALRGALEEEISAHASDLHTLQEEQQQEVQQLREATGQAKESVALLGRRVLEVAEEKEANQTLISDLTHAKAKLLQKTSALEEQISSLNLLIQQKEAQETQLREHAEQLMVEKQHLEEELQEVRQQEEQMCGANRVLTRHLEDTQSELSRVTRAHRELKERRSQEQLQEERCVLEEKLSRCEFDLNEAELKTQQLQKRIQELEENRHTHDDRHHKLMEVRVCELERSVMEERSGSDSLMKRLERGREQMEQLRAELLQERAARQDLECDRIRLERQNKDLRSRVSQLEGSQRSGTDATISKLQLQVHELEERLLGEEKENGELQQQNRRLERHLKELTLHLEEERLELQDQRDQLALRLRTLKRQLDEAEEEMERLENSKKKLQRDLEEQQEQNEQLHTELCGLRRNNRPTKLQITADDEDDEDENETEATLDAN